MLPCIQSEAYDDIVTDVVVCADILLDNPQPDGFVKMIGYMPYGVTRNTHNRSGSGTFVFLHIRMV